VETIPTNPTGNLLELTRLTFELERRVAKQSPFYMAKYIMGNSQRKYGKLWGWNYNHIEASRLIWWAYKTRHERPWGTLVYLEWCRGSRKSTLIQAALACILLDDPNLCCLLDSDVSTKAAQKTAVIRDIFDDERFIELWGSKKSKTRWRTDEWTLERSVMSPDASMKASGLDSSKTGGHFDIIVPDDLQSDYNCKNPDINEQVKNNFRLYETLKSGKTGTVTLVAGTRWGFRDLGDEIARLEQDEERRGVTKSIYIMRRGAYRMRDNKRSYQGHAQFPETGLDEEMLNRIKMKTTPSLFSFNYLLQPLSDEEALIKPAWIRHHDRVTSDFSTETTRFYLAVDPAGEGKFKGADYTAMVVVAVTNNAELFVLETVNAHVGKIEMFNHIVRINEAYPLTGVVVEQYFEQYQLATWMKSRAQKQFLTIPWMKFKASKNSKDQRIGALQPYFQSGKILWRKSHTELEDQALQYPRSEHDDLLDALASALNHAYVPQTTENGPWYMDEAWKDNGTFVPTPQALAPPCDLMVAILRQQERTKQNRQFRSKRRFYSPSLR
jgi:predicted phage terminase large subunit-like protein